MAEFDHCPASGRFEHCPKSARMLWRWDMSEERDADADTRAGVADAEGPAVRRRPLGADKRRLILDAARMIFERDGLEKAGMRAIADAAGYSAGALYFHFPNKDALMAELLLGSLAEAAERMRAAQIEALGPMRVWAAALALYDFLAHDPKEFNLLRALLDRGTTLPPPLAARIAAAIKSLLRPLEEALGAAGAALVLARREAQTLFWAAQGYLLLTRVGGAGGTLIEGRQMMVDHVGHLLARLGKA